MAVDVILTKVESARQAAELGALAGKSAIVTDVSSLTKLATITPESGSAVTVKLDSARQIAELKALVGKSVLVGKSPAALGGIGSWVSLYPVAQGQTAATAAAASGAAGNQLVMMKVVGGEAAAQLPALAGKTFSVVAPPAASTAAKTVPMLYLKPAGAAAGAELLTIPVKDTAFAQAGGLAGKTFTIAKSPVVGANFGQYLVLKPAVAAKATAGGILAAKLGSTAAAGKGAAKAATVAAGSALTPAVGVVNPFASAVAGNAVLTGKGVGLGLGLGLGAWGPVLLGVIGIAGAISLANYVRDFRRREPTSQQALLDELAAGAKG
jgi:hypothetical protein